MASGKGGVGKTWFSITLSHLLAQEGRKVLLVDGDLGMANVDIQLGLNTKRDLVHVIEGSCQLHEAITPFVALNGTRFSILPGRSGSGVLGNMPVQHLTALRENLKVTSKAYHDVVLDLGAGADNTVRVLGGLPATLLVVTNDEPTSITDAYALIKLMVRQKVGLPIQLVVNMSESLSEGERTYQTLAKACKQFLNTSIGLAGIVRKDRMVRDSIRNQQPLAQRYPQSRALGDVQELKQKLLRTHLSTFNATGAA